MKSIIDSFLKIANLYPDKVVLESKNKNLTYSQLNTISNKVGNGLLNKGLRKGDKICISTSDYFEYIVSILACFKVGACYVPIDPMYPAARIQYILNNCHSKLLIGDTQIIGLKSYRAEQLGENESDFLNRAIENNDQDSAYVIYTSGTTGQPKGVEISHLGLKNYLTWAQKYYFENKVANFPLFTSISFDLTITSTFLPLLSGGTIQIISGDDNYAKIQNILTNSKINAIKVTPSHLSVLNEMDLSGLKNLEVVIVGGESLSSKNVNRFLTKIPHLVRVINEYGPTEATVGCMYYEHKGSESDDREPIGKPIDNIQILINDKKDGTGELLISGDSLAKGYINNPELTIKKFSTKYSKTMYHSGDLVRKDNNGDLIYLGRMDDQVKIRGFRIELNEIESAINDIPGVYQSTVGIKNSNDFNSLILGYFTAEKNVSIEKVKDLLAKKLPYYMIPNLMYKIDSFPLTVNGKIDISQLPVFKNVDPSNSANEKSSKKEEIIVSIFENVLNLKHIQPTDNFFDLGGHSLNAIQTINKLNHVSSTKVTMAIFMFAPTARQLASFISVDMKRKVLPVLAENSKTKKLSPVESGVYFQSQIAGEPYTFNIPSLWKLSEALDIKRLRKALLQLVKRHDILRTNFILKDWEINRIIHDEDSIDFDVINKNVDISIIDIAKSLIQPFDLAKDVLFRVRYIASDDNTNYIFIDIHHIISDGRSEVIFFEELGKIYNHQKLSPFRYQYRDYVEWINQKDWESEKHFWVSKLAGKTPQLTIDKSKERTPIKNFAGKTLTFSFPKGMKRNVDRYSLSHHITDYMLFISAFFLLLKINTHSENKFFITSPFSARTTSESEMMLGLFANTVVIDANFKKVKSWNDLLTQVKTTVMQAYDNQEYPFTDLAKSLEEDRNPSRNALADAMFVLQNNASLEDLSFSNSKLNKVDIYTDTSKLDMTFIVESRDSEYLLHVEFNTDIFDDNLIEKLQAEYIELLNNIITDNKELIESYLNNVEEKS